MLQNLFHSLMYSVAKLLRPYLARSPLIWGDRKRLTLGKGVQLVDAIVNIRSGNVIIGDYTFLGHGVMLLTGRHDYQKIGEERQKNVTASGNDIVIGKGVWIASGAIIIAPCQIGDNAVIGAGCVISGDIPKNSITNGAKPLTTRTI